MNPMQEPFVREPGQGPPPFLEEAAGGSPSPCVPAARGPCSHASFHPVSAGDSISGRPPARLDSLRHDAMSSSRGLGLMLWITAMELVFVVISVWCWWRATP